MLVQLAGQFDEIARHVGAADEAVGHVRQHLMQRMAEFMEQRARIVIGQQAGFALGKVADIHHDGAHFAVHPVLIAEG